MKREKNSWARAEEWLVRDSIPKIAGELTGTDFLGLKVASLKIYTGITIDLKMKVEGGWKRRVKNLTWYPGLYLD